MLETRYEDVYKHDAADTVYLAPASLCGVPVEKITETSPYWESSWHSLDAFLAQEEEEKARKEEYQSLKNCHPEDVAIRRKAKFHQDNMSKHVKIREIFGSHSRCHPNLLVAKRHMPIGGLCHKELMYRIACKVSDLKILNDKEMLAMDAWDFIRWRISRKIEDTQSHIGQNCNDRIRTIIYKLCDESEEGSAERYQDPVMRQAVLISASIQGRLASFGNKAVKKKAAIAAQSQVKAYVTSLSSRRRAQSDVQIAHAREREEARRERRRRLASQSGGYKGVNAFRAQQTGGRPA